MNIDPNDELLNFFRALSDGNRLKIVGLLAHEPCSVEHLATVLGLSASTTSHHLAKLAKAGLVSARVDGHYYIYSLHTEIISEMAQRLLQERTLPTLSDETDLEAYDRKVLKAFTDESGYVTALPMQEKKFQVILRYVLKAFTPGVRYTEKEVNQILLRYHKDTAALRRGMIEYRMMQRENNGAAYWLTEESAA